MQWHTVISDPPPPAERGAVPAADSLKGTRRSAVCRCHRCHSSRSLYCLGLLLCQQVSQQQVTIAGLFCRLRRSLAANTCVVLRRRACGWSGEGEGGPPLTGPSWMSGSVYSLN